MQLEGDNWGQNLADELAGKINVPHMGTMLAAVTNDKVHISHLITLSRTQGTNNTDEYSRAVGVCSKRRLETVLKLMEDSCNIENCRKQPVKLLGLVKDTKAAALNEHAKAGLLKSYAEIMRRGNAKLLFPEIERHILHWIMRQLHDCKELAVKEAGLIALEQVSIKNSGRKLIFITQNTFETLKYD